MGIITSQLQYYSTRTDDPDEITGLTSRDKYLVRTSWSTVKKDLVGNGVALLLLFFKKFPEDQRYFPFSDIPLEKLKSDKKFQAHCSNVMHAFDSLVEGLEDGELLVNLLEKLGKNHKRHGISPVAFAHLKETLLELFGGVMSREAIKAWEKTLDAAFGVLEKQL